LNGNAPDRRNYRITDDILESLFLPMIGISFLREIDLSYNEFGDKGAKLLARMIKEDKYLEILNLNSNSIKEEGTEALCKALQLNERLHTFNISNNPIGDMGGMEIARMLQVNNVITNLGISGTGLKATSLIAIWTVVKNNDTLISIDISNNISNLNNLTQSVANDVMLHLSRALSTQTSLKYLNLSRMGITDWCTTDCFANALGTCYTLDTLDLTA
jgi:Ran GTPase-activating protein (RanGAP) involved in mRNA processing and transport